MIPISLELTYIRTETTAIRKIPTIHTTCTFVH